MLLVVSNGSLVGKKDDLDALLGKTVSVTIQPETIEYDEEVENVTVLVSKETIDEFIKKTTTLELPENVTVNVRDALIRLEDGDSLNDIAANHELSETALIDQIETARKYFAPFADTWSKHKDDIIFPEK